MVYGHPSPFPPSFDGNPWAYGMGLFGDIVAGAIALAMLFAHLFEYRRLNYARTKFADSFALREKLSWKHPLSLYRAKHICIWLFVVMRTGPDAAWMLSWGEVSRESIETMLAVDLWLDWISVFPLLYSAYCWACGRQVIPQLLINAKQDANGNTPWEVIGSNAKIILLVLLIAVGVTIGKASG